MMTNKSFQLRPTATAQSRNPLSSALSAAFKGNALHEPRFFGVPSSWPECALSNETLFIQGRVRELRNQDSPAALAPLSSESPLAERLFDATANAKILTAQVAMHLEGEWREKLFRQLDSLHDSAEWEPGDEPIQKSSFATFLKAMVQIKPQRRPGLGLSHGGNLIAAWTTGQDHLTVEFMPNDRVRWVLTRYRDGESEHYAGQSSVSRLVAGLAPFDSLHWFSV